MNEDQYYRIARACDTLLRNPDATLEWIAIPWLHVLNEHPIHLARYADLGVNVDSERERATSFPVLRALRQSATSAYNLASVTKSLVKSAVDGVRQKAAIGAAARGSRSLSRLRRTDIVIVSHLVNVDHVKTEEDFYLGNLQSMLAERGLSSLLLLRNQTGCSTSDLFASVRREGSQARLLLADVVRLSDEADFVRRCLSARRRLRRAEMHALSILDRRAARHARDQVLSGEVVANLRLHSQIARVCRDCRPSVVVTLYEGHAWERCVWHAARTTLDLVLCVGYQHTILRKHSHAVKRSVGGENYYDPDLILTVGDVTRRVLEGSEGLGGIRLLTLGTHRRTNDSRPGEVRRELRVFLVLPEGIESECIYLFDFALKCARHLPNVHFILRTHPVLPFEKIKLKVGSHHSLPGNLEVSESRSIEEDFARAGYILYRGSSTAIYGILAGLKPLYVRRDGEMSIDPLEGLKDWREHVGSVEDFVKIYTSLQAGTKTNDAEEWQRARSFCDSYVRPLNKDAIEQMIEMAEKVRKGEHVVRH